MSARHGIRLILWSVLAFWPATGCKKKSKTYACNEGGAIIALAKSYRGVVGFSQGFQRLTITVLFPVSTEKFISFVCNADSLLNHQGDTILFNGRIRNATIESTQKVVYEEFLIDLIRRINPKRK